MQKTQRNWFGHGSPHRREDHSEPAGGTDLVDRELDPQLLAQLRELQAWALQSRRLDDGAERLASGPAAAARQDVGAEAPPRPEPQPRPAGAQPAPGAPPDLDRQPKAGPLPAAGRQPTIAAKAPAERRPGVAAAPAAPARTRPPARLGRWATIAALLLLVALDAYLLRRASRHPDPAAANGAGRAGQIETTVPSRRSGNPASPAPALPAPRSAALPASGDPPAVPAMPAPRAPAMPAPRAASDAAGASAPTSPGPTPDPAPPGPAPAAPVEAPGGPVAPSWLAPPMARHDAAEPAAPAVWTVREGAASSRGAPPRRSGPMLRRGPGAHWPVLVTVPRVHRGGFARRLRSGSSVAAFVARRFGLESRVQLTVLVDETGRVAAARIAGGDTSRIEVDRAALAAAYAARFRPATRNGIPGRMWTRLSLDVAR